MDFSFTFSWINILYHLFAIVCLKSNWISNTYLIFWWFIVTCYVGFFRVYNGYARFLSNFCLLVIAFTWCCSWVVSISYSELFNRQTMLIFTIQNWIISYWYHFFIYIISILWLRFNFFGAFVYYMCICFDFLSMTLVLFFGAFHMWKL